MRKIIILIMMLLIASCQNDLKQNEMNITSLSITAHSTDICGYVTLNIDADENIAKIVMPNDEVISPATTPVQTSVARGSGTIRVEVENDAGDKAVDFIQIPSILNPNAISIDKIEVSGNTDITITDNTQGLTLEYKIDSGTYQSEPYFEGIVNGNYTLYVRDQFGCYASIPFSCANNPMRIKPGTSIYHMIAGQSPSFIQLENVDEYVDAIFTIQGVTIQNRYTAINGEVNIELTEITRLIYQYDNDIFDYSGYENYSIGTNGYHIAWLDYSFIDGNAATLDGYHAVINASLQIGDNEEMQDYYNEILTEGRIKMPVWKNTAGQFYPKSVSRLLRINVPPPPPPRPVFTINRSTVTSSLGSSSEVIETNGCGVYIKWLNQKASYSYWFFEGNYGDNFGNKSLGKISDYFLNITDAIGSHKSLGFDTDRALNVIQDIDNRYIEEVKTLLSSPEVYLYVGDLTTHRWVKMMQSGNTSIIRGATSTKIKINLEFPEQYSITK